MDMDTLPVPDFGSTPSVGSRLQRALQVYEAVWDEFYIQEVTYCEDVIKGCERPTDHPSTEIQDQLEVVDYVPLEFHLRPRNDDELLEDFTIEQFDASGNSERYSTMYCFDASKGARRPYSYATYESCTPGSRNEIKVDPHGGALAFIPYADDEKFKIHEYISYFDLLAWQSDFPDPDWELIELEVMTRLVLDCNWRLTIREVDELQILRKSRMSYSSGLFWDTSQRDEWHWMLPNAKLSKNSLQHRWDIARHIDDNFPQFCPKLYCLRFFCGAHGTLFPNWHGINYPEPKKTSKELKKRDLSKQYCGRSCFRLVYSGDTPSEKVVWENEDDITLVESVLKILPDASPCDLAIICRKRCSEIYAFRYNTIKDEKIVEVSIPPKQEQYVFVDEEVDNEVYEMPLPCYHKGPCIEDSCTCLKSNVHCQRSCQCDKDCSVRWKGCRCGKKRRRKTGELLCSSAECACRRSGRECDPDVCIGCDARGKTKGKKCHNVEFQRGNFPPLAITFGIHGLGSQTLTTLQEGRIIGGKSFSFLDHDFVSLMPAIFVSYYCVSCYPLSKEYVGEIMSVRELESPSHTIIHNHTGFNYKYEIRHDLVLDGAKLGNETRYLNDSKDEPDKNNCYGQIFLIDGDFRLALVTSRKIQKSEELLLGYGDKYWKPPEI